MPEVDLGKVFSSSWVKRIIFLGILGFLLWKYFPAISYRFSINKLDRATNMVVRTIKDAKSFTMCHEGDNYAADFNLKDNTFALVYPLPQKFGERKIIEQMRVLPAGIEIIKCSFTPVLIKGIKDPDENKLVYRLSFNKEGSAHLDESAIWLGDTRGGIREISVTNPQGKVRVFREKEEE